MSLLDRLKKNTTIKDSSILAKSKFFSQKDMVQTDVPMINVALSGSLDGGITQVLPCWHNFLNILRVHLACFNLLRI